MGQDSVYIEHRMFRFLYHYVCGREIGSLDAYSYLINMTKV